VGARTDGGRRGDRGSGARSAGGGAGAHLKRYGPFYAVGVVILLVALVLPQLQGDDAGDADDDVLAAGEARDGDAPWSPGSGDIEAGTGTARSGVACEPGVGQIPDTIYSVPCVPEFTGDNGGSTFRGVTEDTIRIAVRAFPSTANQQATRQELADAGYATPEVSQEIQAQFLEYFNDNFELYGRRVELVPYVSQFGNSTSEALGQGREGACQDATLIVEELDAFGVVGEVGGAGVSGGLSAVFSECAAERELVVFQGAAYYPETFYEDLHPHVWHTAMNCLSLNEHMAEYIGERLAGKPAIHAGDPAMHDRERVFGAYSPDNEQYVTCSEASGRTLQEEYGVERGSVFRYALDISRFNEQAQRAILQFKEDGVTTIIASADPISVGMMTNHAAEQDYFPEWVISGTAGLDQNNFGRQFNQEVVDGHLFGISQLSSSDAIYGPDAEPPSLYRELTGEEIPKGTTGDFYGLVQLFDFLQAAGPDLTPENMATGVQTMPVLGGDGRPVWSWQEHHTATQDALEVYWDGSAEPGPEEPGDDLSGSYVETYDGRRFLPGEWPDEDPPVYPDR
jgi:hypothetical protein